MPEQAQSSLPEGYRFEEPAAITPRERAELMRNAGWNTSSPKLITGDMRYQSEGIDLLHVGVRGEDDKLVGFGRMLSAGEHGEFCDFIVEPAHRMQGIGKAIIDERLRRAEAIDVTSFYIPYLLSTNTLSSYYGEKGFRSTPIGELVRGPHPVPVSDAINSHYLLQAIQC